MDSRLNAFLERAESVLARLEPLLPAVRAPVDWEKSLAARWVREGRTGYLMPLEVTLDMRLSDLIGVDHQRAQLGRNTQQFIDGLPANHALLWGSRGTGKSSLVRALLAEHAKAGLRLIEIERDHLGDLPRVVEQLQKLAQRFVLFCDDLSFESGEGDYRVLKSVLDGSLEQAPDNVLLYATSNRRHLVPEKESDNAHWQRGDDGEIHPSEAVEDKIALSDRFGALPFADLLQPAIKLAQEGFPVSPVISFLWNKDFQALRGQLSEAATEHWFSTFAPEGRAPVTGEIFRSEAHARTLESLAQSRCESFYRGELAEAIDGFSRKTGGFLRKEDLAAYQPEWVKPIKANYRGYDIWEIPPNGQGIVALMALKIASGFELQERETLDSYHTVWFELHEDILRVLGREREE